MGADLSRRRKAVNATTAPDHPRRRLAAEEDSLARLLLFNKPYGVLCQFRSQPGQLTLGDYIQVPGVYPAGRLDKDSEGLLLLTDDGSLQHRLSHPRHKRWKTYWVQVEGRPDASQIAALRAGIELNDGPTLPARVRPMAPPELWPREPPIRIRQSIPTTWIELRIREGRNRQVRRMTAAVGLPTLRLVRVRIGDFSLGDLLPGQLRLIPARSSPQSLGQSLC